MIDLNDVLLAMSNIPVYDPIAEIWGRGLQGGYKIIEYTGSLPITISANGDALIDYRVYGASGGVGKPTKSGEPAGYKLLMVISDQNLLDDNISRFANGYVNVDGGTSLQDATKKEKYSDYVSIVPNTNYIFAMANGFPGDPSGDVNTKPWRTIAFYRQNKSFISRQPVSSYDALNPSPFTVTSPSNAFFTRVTWRSYGSEECPVLAASRNLPIYIGENTLDNVEGVSDYVDKSSGKIVRMIGEYTFTGDENFGTYGVTARFSINPSALSTSNQITCRCSHFTAATNRPLSLWNNTSQDKVCGFRTDDSTIVFRNTEEFVGGYEAKTYFKAQYDNGTPVKLWYIMETPIEEDPPVSFPEIPTIDGTTVIDYDGDPKPSQMYIKYKGKG